MRMIPLSWSHALATGAALVTLVSCSTPGDKELFHVVNETGETLTLRWKTNPVPLATLTPGGGTSVGVHPSRCTNPDHQIVLSASSEANNNYEYGPGVCPGAMWKIRDR
ncbi:hypothetical protein GCM10012278_23140 [Nonomuraea glycinis]|uniref:Uncharacterized protein n=1 Tax=Nonomuraea glycinis TaxID=2047744 RepID=A0A918A3X2_9ACTN|nr:hypothetical protein GCM10012278_23140 [Nonomuraea glycinis]